MPDLNQLLETLLRGLEAGEVTNGFLWLLLVILVLAIVSKMRGWLPRFTAYAPVFLTSLGIFGTFVGIVIGLLDFELKQINGGIVGSDIAQNGQGRLGINQSQIVGLLEGLKTAFISSIAGLGASLFFKFLTTTFTSLFPESEEGDEDTDIPWDILVALNKQTQLLEATQKAIAGTEESSLAGQVRLLREEHKSAHEKQTQLLEMIVGAEESSLTGQVKLLRKDHKSAHAEQMKLLEETQEAIAGTEESSLTGQVRLLREDHKTAHKEFAEQLWQEFAKQMKQLEETQEAIAGNEESSLVGQVKLLREDHKTAHEKQTQLLEATQEAIAGDEESSLAGQVRLLREAHKNAHEEFTDQLWRKLDDFAEIMSRSATEQVIEALKEVITDFNQNLTEQFGDNFKELNAAVEKLVKWQENYREQLQQLHKLYEESTTAIKDIEQRCALIPQSMDKLEPIIETATRQIAELEQHLATFAEMRDKATEAIPQIQNQTRQMADDIAASVSLASERYKQLSKDTEKLQTNTANSLAKFLKGTEDLQQELTNGFKEIQQQMDAIFRETLSRTEGTVQKQLQALNDATEKALTEVINEMGENLGKISGKFVEDYQELTETMAGVIEQAGTFDKKR